MSIERISSQHSYESVHNQVTISTENIKQSIDSPIVDGKNEKHEISKVKLEELVKGLNEFIQPSHTALKFELHNELNEYYIQIIDERTKEVIREIPPKKLLDIYANMMQFIGLIVDKKI
jgi:flagellar protein FlaG